MADPHNKARYGELWDQSRIDAYLENLEFLKDLVVFSGGFAWHFMSEAGHPEYKHAHDHKDVDIFVAPENVVEVIEILMDLGFKKVHTRYAPGEADFRRYEMIYKDKKLTIDFFVGEMPVLEINGWKVIEPRHLLSLYKSVHSSDNCFAVLAAAKIIAKGESPVGRKELSEIPK